MTDDLPIPAPPSDLVTEYGPDAETKAALTDIERVTLCGGRFAVDWNSGPWKGQRLAVYCQQPGCIPTGKCTGPMFVPSFPQYDRLGRTRTPSPEEMIAGAREGARKATGRNDPRSDREIARHIGRIWKATLDAAKGRGWGF